MQASVKSAYDCIKQFSETDFTADLAQIEVPTLVANGDDDQIVPIQASAMRTARLVKDAKLKIYSGGSHGFAQTHAARFNQDLLSFIKTGKVDLSSTRTCRLPKFDRKTPRGALRVRGPAATSPLSHSLQRDRFHRRVDRAANRRGVSR